MTSPILVSVIIPCYNVEEYIVECLDSVYNQTYAHIEVIVVDNNSVDNTLQLVHDYKERNHAPLTITQEKNQGLSFARNAGLEIAKGEWIQFLDADDLLLTEKISHQVGLIQKDLDLITAATIERNVDGSEVIMVPHENIVFGLIAGFRNVGSSCSNLWKKQTLLDLNGFDTAQMSSVEIDMMFRLYKNGARYLQDPKPLTIIRKRVSGQMSQDNKDKLAFYWLRLRMKQLDWFFLQNKSSLDRELMITLFDKILYNIYYQSSTFPILSHQQYHNIVKPIFSSYIKHLSFKHKIKLYLFVFWGFNMTGKSLRLISHD